MKRLLVFALALSLGQSSVAFAGESLLESAKRVTREMTQAQTVSTQAPRIEKSGPATKRGPAFAALQGAQGPPTLENSGMRKRTKWMIAMAAVVGFVAAAYTVDHRVEDPTPSSLGTREDGL